MYDDTKIGGRQEGFPATRLSAIERARSDVSRERSQALDALIGLYWKPIYKYIRLRWRKSNEDAKDLTQDFFVQLTEKELLAAFDPEKARLRTFLRTCVDRLVQKRDRDARRLKRGGDAEHLAFDFVSAEAELARMGPPPADAMLELFEREWVRALFSLAVDDLEADCGRRQRELDFRLFELYDLSDDPSTRPTYGALAAELGIRETTVTNRLAAARKRFRRLVLERLREMTGSEAEYRAEARSILGVVLE